MNTDAVIFVLVLALVIFVIIIFFIWFKRKETKQKYKQEPVAVQKLKEVKRKEELIREEEWKGAKRKISPEAKSFILNLVLAVVLLIIITYLLGLIHPSIGGVVFMFGIFTLIGFLIRMGDEKPYAPFFIYEKTPKTQVDTRTIEANLDCPYCGGRGKCLMCSGKGMTASGQVCQTCNGTGLCSCNVVSP